MTNRHLEVSNNPTYRSVEGRPHILCSSFPSMYPRLSFHDESSEIRVVCNQICHNRSFAVENVFPHRVICEASASSDVPELQAMHYPEDANRNCADARR